jgi:DNA-directed RNA polymerase subunit M/transcription elongation factor TFIIS
MIFCDTCGNMLFALVGKATLHHESQYACLECRVRIKVKSHRGNESRIRKYDLTDAEIEEIQKEMERLKNIGREGAKPGTH